MTSSGDGEREKIVSKLPAWLHRDLKVRAAQLGIDIQAAVEAGIGLWQAAGAAPEEVDTAGADSFSTWLPGGLYDGFRGDCAARGVSYVQGLAQAVTMWLDAHPAAQPASARRVRRIVVCNQKGGVGKTAVSAGLAQALAEGYQAGSGRKPAAVPGARVLLIDYDPQGHLTKQLGVAQIEAGKDSLALHMSGEAKGDIRDLIVTLPHDRWGGRLHLLPACTDAFLLDVRLSQLRARERALERALAAVEDEYDAIVVDCPPSLGMSVDAAIYYARRRHAEDDPRGSGVLIPVQAEDSSADAFTMLTGQISDLCGDVNVTVDYLGLVVTMYDARRGYIATSSLDNWKALGDPRVVATVPDLKEQREAVRQHQPLLDYAPRSEQAVVMRDLAREIS